MRSFRVMLNRVSLKLPDRKALWARRVQMVRMVPQDFKDRTGQMARLDLKDFRDRTERWDRLALPGQMEYRGLRGLPAQTMMCQARSVRSVRSEPQARTARWVPPGLPVDPDPLARRGLQVRPEPRVLLALLAHKARLALLGQWVTSARLARRGRWDQSAHKARLAFPLHHRYSWERAVLPR
jgi:hypothetical protein